TLAFVRAAADAGAHVANHAEALRLCRLDDRVTGAEVRDTLSGQQLRVRADVVLVAAGPATETLLAPAGVARRPPGAGPALGPGRRPPPPRVVPARSEPRVPAVSGHDRGGGSAERRALPVLCALETTDAPVLPLRRTPGKTGRTRP